MVKIITGCDMASIKIYTNDVSLFFDNELGDGVNIVNIIKGKVPKEAKFLGHFTVKTKAWLSRDDCDDIKVYEFTKGRWWVHLIENECIFYIRKEDEDIHA
jgi:hypothetical protein